MILLNLPVAALSVRADGDEQPAAPEERSYTLYWDKENDEVVLKEGDTVISDGSYLYPGTISLVTSGGEGDTTFHIIWNNGDPQNVTSDEYTLAHYAKFRWIGHQFKDLNSLESSDTIDIALDTAYHVTVSSNIWCDFEITLGDIHERYTDIRDRMKISDYDPDDYGEPVTFDFDDEITAFEAEMYHTPEDIGNDNPDYDHFRFTGFEINGEPMTEYFRYALNHFEATNLTSSDSFDPGNGLINIKISGDATHGSTIEWADSTVPEEHIHPNLISEHCVFDHGSAEILAVLDDDGEEISQYYDLDNCKDEYGNGGIIVESGYQIVFKLIPEYGYQLYSVNENGFPNKVPTCSTDNSQACIYNFQVHDNCVHFSSTFRREPDILDAEHTNEVPEGRVDLSDANLSGGTGLVTVSDIDEAAYADAQWDNGLEAQEFFNIDLTNRYRIANTDDQYWENEIHELSDDGTAAIALELGDDFVPVNDNIQVIHIPTIIDPETLEETAGEPEYLDTTYDPGTHTVYFTTTGFSDYIIGSTDEEVPGVDQEIIDNINNQDQFDDQEFHPEYTVDKVGNEYQLVWYEYPEDGPAEIKIVDYGRPIEDDALIRIADSIDLPVTVMVGEAVRDPGDNNIYTFGEWLSFDSIEVNENGIIVHFEPNDNPYFAPQYTIVRQGEGYGLASFQINEEDPEGEPVPVFKSIDDQIEDDAEIRLDGGLNINVTYKLDGNVVPQVENEDFVCLRHFAFYKGIEETETGIIVNFVSCWVVQLDSPVGFDVTVLDEAGQPVIPFDCGDDFAYPFTPDMEINERGEEFYTVCLIFNEKPYKAVICGHDSILTEIIDEGYEVNPVGDNEIYYPTEDECGYVWVRIGGYSILDSGCVNDFYFECEGLSAEEAGRYVIAVNDINDLSENDIASINSIVEGLFSDGYSNTVQLFLIDISLYKDGEQGTIHDPGFSVTITLQLDSPLDLEDGESIALIHFLENGDPEVIEAAYDADNLTLTFVTSTFSPFLGCKLTPEEDIPEDNPGTETTTPAITTPVTPAPSGTETTPGTGNTGTSVTPTPAEDDSGTRRGVEAFVERLYTVALGRNPDPAGQQDWVDAIRERGQTGADVARGFLYSPEFINKDCSNEVFVQTLYQTFFDRAADPAGLEAWVGVLDGGESRQDVIEGFINSTEWANLCLFYGIRSGGTGVPSIEIEPNDDIIAFCTRLYTTCLGRNADQNGLMAWARQLANQRDTGAGAARGFFFSEEFLGRNVDNDEYVRRLYLTFMGREPDEAGYNAWVAQLDSGISREEVFEGFVGSQEFTRLCAYYGIVRG